MMAHIFVSLLLVTSSIYFSWAISPSILWCDNGSKLHDLRIEGCLDQPCAIRKGEPLPFEINVSFTKPENLANRVDFQVFISYYAVPPAFYGSYLSSASCDHGDLGFHCHISANVTHTLKSFLFIDKNANCTAGCNDLGPDGTGLRKTQWSWNIQNSQGKAPTSMNTVEANQSYSSCYFQVALNITNK